MTTEHTQTPWRIKYREQKHTVRWDIEARYSPSGTWKTIFKGNYYGNEKANAELIVKAVNSFEAMKAVIMEGMARLEATGISEHETYSHKRDKAAQAYYNRLQRALALAEGKEGQA